LQVRILSNLFHRFRITRAQALFDDQRSQCGSVAKISK
jgi:hypothetical protein